MRNEWFCGAFGIGLHLCFGFFCGTKSAHKKIFAKDNKIFKFILYYYMEDLWILLELLRWLPWHLVRLGL